VGLKTIKVFFLGSESTENISNKFRKLKAESKGKIVSVLKSVPYHEDVSFRLNTTP
jgi:hypothetical protein